MLVRIRAASLNLGDWYAVTGRPYVGRTELGLRKPKSNTLGVAAKAPFLPPKTSSTCVPVRIIEAGKLTPVIDRQYELSEIAEALHYLGEGHAQGKIVITV